MRPVAFNKYNLTPTVVTLLIVFRQWDVIVLKEVHLESQVNQSRKSDGNCYMGQTIMVFKIQN